MTPENRALVQELNRTLLQLLEYFHENGLGGNGYKIVIFLVPIFGIVFGSILLGFVFYWWYKQRMELIRHNLYKVEPFDFKAFSFLLGLLLTFTGLTLSIVFIMVLGNSLAMLGGLIPLAIGLSLLIYYKAKL
jgi:hypothetical protein